MASAETTAAIVTSRVCENGSRKWPAIAVVTMNPTIIITHTMVAAAARRCSSTRFASSTSRVVPADPTPRPISRNDNDRERDTGPGIGRHPGGGERRSDAAQCQNRHPADDPGRPASADVRSVSEPRPGDLDGIVQGHQGAGQHGRQRQFDHHHAIQGGCRQHHDRAERRLYQPQAYDPEPSTAVRASWLPRMAGEQGECAHEHAEDIKADTGRAVPGRPFLRLPQEAAHQFKLDEQQKRHDDGVDPGAPRQQDGDHDRLRHRHDDARQFARHCRHPVVPATSRFPSGYRLRSI